MRVYELVDRVIHLREIGFCIFNECADGCRMARSNTVTVLERLVEQVQNPANPQR